MLRVCHQGGEGMDGWGRGGWVGEGWMGGRGVNGWGRGGWVGEGWMGGEGWMEEGEREEELRWGGVKMREEKGRGGV